MDCYTNLQSGEYQGSVRLTFTIVNHKRRSQFICIDRWNITQDSQSPISRNAWLFAENYPVQIFYSSWLKVLHRPLSRYGDV